MTVAVTRDSHGFCAGKRCGRVVFGNPLLVWGQLDDQALQQRKTSLDRRAVILEPVKFLAELRCESLLDFVFAQRLQRVLVLSNPLAAGEKAQRIAADQSDSRRAGLPSQNGIQAQQGGDRWCVLALPAAGFAKGIDARAAAARDFGLGQLQLEQPGLNKVGEPLNPLSWNRHISHFTAPNARNLISDVDPGFLSYPLVKVAS